MGNIFFKRWINAFGFITNQNKSLFTKVSLMNIHPIQVSAKNGLRGRL